MFIRAHRRRWRHSSRQPPRARWLRCCCAIFTFRARSSTVLCFWYSPSSPIASMCAGNLLALLQTNVKRILAYSSIAHFGYVLVAFLAGGTDGDRGGELYLVAYTVTILGAFGIVTVLSGSERDADDLEDYRGLFWRRPVIAGVFTAALLSLAGIPATMGFLGKFYVLAAGAAAAAWPLIIILVVTSVAGLFYYLRIVVALYSAPPERAPIQMVSRGGAFILVVLTILLDLV